MLSDIDNNASGMSDSLCLIPIAIPAGISKPTSSRITRDGECIRNALLMVLATELAILRAVAITLALPPHNPLFKPLMACAPMLPNCPGIVVNAAYKLVDSDFINLIMLFPPALTFLIIESIAVLDTIDSSRILAPTLLTPVSLSSATPLNPVLVRFIMPSKTDCILVRMLDSPFSIPIAVPSDLASPWLIKTRDGLCILAAPLKLLDAALAIPAAALETSPILLTMPTSTPTPTFLPYRSRADFSIVSEIVPST